jgi:hypothetical protein
VRVFPYPITAESLAKQTTKISRFTSINERANLVPINHLLVNNLLLCRTNFINCDRSYVNGGVSIFLPSPALGKKRAIPLYWCLLPKLGNSNLSEQTLALQQVLPLFKEYKVIVLGSREFCSVDLGSWPGAMGVSFCLRLKKNHSR